MNPWYPLMSQPQKISAKTFVQDVKSGLDGPALIAKYDLSEHRLSKILTKCLELQLLTSDEVDVLIRQATTSNGGRQTSRSGQGSSASPAPHSLGQDDELTRYQASGPRDGPTYSIVNDEQRAGLFEVGADQGGGQRSSLWALKLYSKTLGSREKFSRDLASILAIDVRTAGEFLDQAPVIIKSGLTKEKAERLSSILASIGALCLIEEQEPSAKTSGAEKTNSELAFFPPRGKFRNVRDCSPANCASAQ